MRPEIYLEELMKGLPGVSHVLLLTEDAKPMQFLSLGTLPSEWIRGLEQFAGSLTVALTNSAKSISDSNKTPYQPMRGWFYTGGDWGVCVASLEHISGPSAGSGFVAAFFLTGRADSKAIFDAMIARRLKS